MTLEEWARQKRTKIVVVTADDGWKRFIGASEELILVEDLVEALNAFQKEVAAHVFSDVIHQELIGVEPPLVKAVEDALHRSGDKMDFDLEIYSQFYVEGDVDSVTFKFVDTDQIKQENAYQLIEQDGENLVASIMVDVEYTIEASFSFDHWDSIDKEYLSMGSGSTEVDEIIPVEIILTFTKGADEPYELSDIEVVATGRTTLTIGEVEPDWMSNPDDE